MKQMNHCNDKSRKCSTNKSESNLIQIRRQSSRKNVLPYHLKTEYIGLPKWLRPRQLVSKKQCSSSHCLHRSQESKASSLHSKAQDVTDIKTISYDNNTQTAEICIDNAKTKQVTNIQVGPCLQKPLDTVNKDSPCINQNQIHNHIFFQDKYGSPPILTLANTLESNLFLRRRKISDQPPKLTIMVLNSHEQNIMEEKNPHIEVKVQFTKLSSSTVEKYTCKCDDEPIFQSTENEMDQFVADNMKTLVDPNNIPLYYMILKEILEAEFKIKMEKSIMGKSEE